MINQTEKTSTNVFEHGEIAYYKPKSPALDKNKRPYVIGGRVVTRVKSKEYHVVYRTFHKDPDIQALYEEFKMMDNKPFWLSENRERLQKFDINVDNLIEIYKNA